uniref:Uncharacterized protein n=1 Tax=Glossina brevipalpis TaxID=37001 RepID=A0A1A9WK03_9MUSC
MSILNDMTFEKLKCMQDDHIIPNLMSALQICRKSGADPTDVYKLWVRKLFQAYDISELQYDDWFQIMAYLKVLLEDVIKDTNTDLNTFRIFNSCLSDTQQLLIRFETVINAADVGIWSLLISFALEVVIMFLRAEKKGHAAVLIAVQKQLLNLITKSIKEIKVKNDCEFQAVVQVLTFLCDASSLFDSLDFKVAIESWHVVAKLISICLVLSKSFEGAKENQQNGDRADWSEQPSLKILKELKKCLQYLENQNDVINGNVLKVISFYSKLLKHLVNNCTSSVLKEFLEMYRLNKHILQRKNYGAIGKAVDQTFCEMFSKIYQEKEVGRFVLQHVSHDAAIHFFGCNFLQDYLAICLENHYQGQDFLTDNFTLFLQIFIKLFETPLIYADSLTYNEILEYYVVLALLDSSNGLHRHLCKFVLEGKWTLAFASSQTLQIYYSCQCFNVQYYVACLEFWLKCLERYNVCKFHERKSFIQHLIKPLIDKVPEHLLSEQRNKLSDLLLVANDNYNSLDFNFRLKLNLQKLKTENGNFVELITKMNFLINNTNHVGDSMDSIIHVFEDLLKYRPFGDYSRFQLFFDTCFKLFVSLSSENGNAKILKCLEENDKNVASICSVFMLEFIIKYRNQLLYKILPESLAKSLEKVITLLDVKLIIDDSQKEDLKIFFKLPKLNMESPPLDSESHVRKKPCQDLRPTYNVKTILNNMLENSIELQNLRPRFDLEDLKILEKIKRNIDKW